MLFQKTRMRVIRRINESVKDPAEADRMVAHIATSAPEVLTDEGVRESYRAIVCNDELSTDAKYYLLDGLLQRVWNYHPKGMAAEVCEEILNESTALQFPNANWHGRCGNWTSVRERQVNDV